MTAIIPVRPVVPDSPPPTETLIAATVHCAFQGRARIVGVAAAEPAAVRAIIAAAVHTVFGNRVRIVAVGAVRPDTPWAHEGRRDIFYSHRVR